LLADLAKRLMVIPTSQADTERMFSKVTGSYGLNRWSLHDESLNKVLFLKEWL
jgi:hypothetical protein